MSLVEPRQTARLLPTAQRTHRRIFGHVHVDRMGRPVVHERQDAKNGMPHGPFSLRYFGTVASGILLVRRWQTKLSRFRTGLRCGTFGSLHRKCHGYCELLRADVFEEIKPSKSN